MEKSVGKGFAFTENETRRYFSYLSGTLGIKIESLSKFIIRHSITMKFVPVRLRCEKEYASLLLLNF